MTVQPWPAVAMVRPARRRFQVDDGRDAPSVRLGFGFIWCEYWCRWHILSVYPNILGCMDQERRDLFRSLICKNAMGLKPTDRDVLRDLLPPPRGNGDNIQTNIADNTGRSPKAVSQALERLEDDDLVRNKGRGVYRLTNHGRDIAQNLSDLGDAL